MHFHVKVRAPGYPELTTQVYLPDAIVEAVLSEAPYADSADQVRNGDDNFYAEDTLLQASGSAQTRVTATGTLVLS